jgi:stage II sporulation protein D
MHFGAFLIASLVALSVQAETIRVAVARGQKFQIEGGSLSIHSKTGEPAEELDSPAIFEHVGPFISSGDALDTSWIIEDADGALTVNGIVFGGAVELVLDKDTVVAIDNVDLESYVASVVGAEMSPSWPAAALEAQSVAARTYVLQRREVLRGRAPYDLESTVAAQVYKGRDSHSIETVLAADATKGQVLKYGGKLAEAYFFSKCSGKTESAKSAFGKGAPYLNPVSCETDDALAGLTWSKSISLESIARTFQIKGDISNIRVANKTETGRVASVSIESSGGTRRVTGADFRRLLGYQVVPSLAFKLSVESEQLIVEGAGSGHGVGLCQWGAYAMAKRGSSAEEILQHFYPGTTIEPLASDVVAISHP